MLSTTLRLTRTAAVAVRPTRRMPCVRLLSAAAGDIFNPSEEHRQLRDMVRGFTQDRVEPQALEFNRREEFNMPLFRELGEIGLLGVTVPVDYGGSGMDASAACIIHEELASSDPAFCPSYLAHSMLFVSFPDQINKFPSVL